jgi:RNA polymerase sigma-70 factor (ECF subfamily)
MNDGCEFQDESPDARWQTISQTLLERVRCQDQQAWSRLVHLFAPLVYDRCRSVGLQEADANDVVQEVFIAVAKNIADFRRDRPGDSFRKWLSTITGNEIRDSFRRQAKRPRASGGTDAQLRLAEIPEETVDLSSLDEPLGDRGGLEQRLKDLIRTRVEETTWQAFYLVTVEDQTVADVA